VTSVVVTGNPLLGIRTDRPNISTGARIASQRAARRRRRACHRQGRVAQFTDACVRDPKVVALRGKVEVLRDESFSTIAAAVEITTADGKVHQLSQPAARGSDANPMSDTLSFDRLHLRRPLVRQAHALAATGAL
jgi:hypothetical protein